VAKGIFDGTGHLAYRVNGFRGGAFSLAIQTLNATLFDTFPRIFSSFTQPTFVHNDSPVNSLVAKPFDVDN